MLYETRTFGSPRFKLDRAKGWTFGSIPKLGLTWAEGHPAPERLASASEVVTAATSVRELLDDLFGVVKDRGVSRSDQTTTHAFERPQEARAFLTGMAVVQLPGCQTTRRGHPVQSVWWTHATGTRTLARAYDKGLERGGEAFRYARLEDQRRYRSGERPTVDVVADPRFLWGKFTARFGPIQKVVNGVKAASFPVVAQALADEVRNGYRTPREAERLAGSLILMTGGSEDAYPRATRTRRKRELREAGYVLADDLYETVEVNLGDVIEQALDPAAWHF